MQAQRIRNISKNVSFRIGGAFRVAAILAMATIIVVLLVNLLSGLKNESCLERYLNHTGIIEEGGCRYMKVIFVSEQDCQSIIPNLRNKTMDAFRREFMDDPDTANLTDCILNELNKTRAAEYQMTIGHVREHYLYRNFHFAGNSSLAENATAALANLKVQSVLNCKDELLSKSFYHIQDVVQIHDVVINFE